MRLVLELLNRRLTIVAEHQTPSQGEERHDSELDSYVERADHRDMDPASEMDQRTRRLGFGQF